MELLMNAIRFSSRHLPAKDLLRNGMCPFREMKWRDAWPGSCAQKQVGLRGVSILHVNRNEKAGIGVNRQ
jgi:hypothetical protein